ncbi:MAG TPA: hypothetical protein PLJ27_06230 [Polyangiaceae bacterium]|jgi:hypothetical protein|nr:MAG: hypothetical protein BWY17_03445 [Deltaproteobacteria bacterium ADurb.Bin207]HNS98388.1 hypothetical protein [Polyangiaceae bacterium]HNZ25412.1 hypothetical protein [Polyangiaceae bacterium]HOD24993.1 hypothetical protein [Polyangiaceae bacterium]HOE51303.1 hypothetical protein [Polyangiaceae bacterium]
MGRSKMVDDETRTGGGVAPDMPSSAPAASEPQPPPSTSQPSERREQNPVESESVRPNHSQQPTSLARAIRPDLASERPDAARPGSTPKPSSTK